MKRAQRGFTLMELIIAMVIIGVLTAIAIPNYTAYIQRSRRAEARNVLLEATVWMERWRTERGQYDRPPPAVAGTAPPLPFTVVPATGAVNYNVAVATPNAVSYTITATAVGLMAGDACSTLTITETGLRGFTTGGGGTQEVCWSR
ncbi:MAG: prepilin-type N-terminal cleavage/methylation domain-containing protein [Burkholderiaceae bacterium]|nr:prepilin-type N-terminal cleavage/methylation domain-containing protein [Burkholderiaceae bacterium]